MTPLGAYTKAISDRIATVIANNMVIADPQLGNVEVGKILNGIPVVVEDVADLETQIANAVNQVGMIILIGMPTGQDTGKAVSTSDDKITSAISVGEVPTVWRDNPLTKPVCLDVVYALKVSLQGLAVAGFGQLLHATRFDLIPDKKRQLYEITIESRLITEQTV